MSAFWAFVAHWCNFSLSLSLSLALSDKPRQAKEREKGRTMQKLYNTVHCRTPSTSLLHAHRNSQGRGQLSQLCFTPNQPSRLQGFILNGGQGRVNYTHERRQTQGNKIAQNLIMPTQSAHAFRKSEHFFSQLQQILAPHKIYGWNLHRKVDNDRTKNIM